MPMIIKCWEEPSTSDINITITVPSEYVLNAKSTNETRTIARMIDMPQFFGMLEDTVCMKLGVEKPKTDDKGHNAI